MLQVNVMQLETCSDTQRYSDVQAQPDFKVRMCPEGPVTMFATVGAAHCSRWYTSWQACLGQPKLCPIKARMSHS